MTRTRHAWARFGALRTVACALGLASAGVLLTSAAVAHEPSELLRSKAPHAAKLGARFAEHPSGIRIIVKLAVPGLPDGIQAGGRPDAAFATALVSSVQDAVLSSHLGSDPTRIEQWSTRKIGTLPYMAMNLTAAETEMLAGDPRIVEIIEDATMSPSLTESVPLIGMTTATTGAYAQGADGAGTAVVILDTGVDTTHPFFAGKVVSGACFSSRITYSNALVTPFCPNGLTTQIGVGAGVNCPNSITGCNHGTHVAGIAAGKGTGTTPPNGVAKAAKIIPVQVFSKVTATVAGSSCGPSAPCITAFTSDLLAALDWVATNATSLGTTIASVNMSLGGSTLYATACDTDPHFAAFNALIAKNIAPVVASGNDGYPDGVASPGCVSSAVTVGSTTKADVISSFSNSGSGIDLLAPGSAIVSSVPGGAYASFNGTSMATPHVAGAFAALRSLVPSASVSQIRNVLEYTGVPIADTRTGGKHTRNRIQVDKAAAELRAMSPGINVVMTPNTGLTASRPLGAPFTSPTQVYQIVNKGSIPVSLNIAASNSSVAEFAFTGMSYTSSAYVTLESWASVKLTVRIPSNVTTVLSEGTFYSDIRVTLTGAGTLFETRPVTMTITPPAAPDNDTLANAFPLTAPSTMQYFKTHLATREMGEPEHMAGAAGTNSVWWKYTPTASGMFYFSASGPTADQNGKVAFGVYTGPSVARLVQIVTENSTYFGSWHTASNEFYVDAGKTYYIAVETLPSNITQNYSIYWVQRPSVASRPGLFGAILPYARAVQVGTTATAFANIINTATQFADNCGLQMPADNTGATPGTFFFRAATAANAVDPGYKVNQPVQIAAGATQNFIFGFTPSASFNATEIPIVMRCGSPLSLFSLVTSYNGVNTFILSASAAPVADLVAIGATTSNDGIVSIPGTAGTHFFAASAVNIGAADTITASVDDGGKNLPITLSICRTNPTTGACVTPAVPGASATAPVANNEIATYTVFVTGRGTVPFDPANNRLFLRLKDASGVTRGATNMAVRTR